jgi:hypothetical protein
LTKHNEEALQIVSEILALIKERDEIGPAIPQNVRAAQEASRTSRQFWNRANAKQRRLDEIEQRLIELGFDLPPRPNSWKVEFLSDENDQLDFEGYEDAYLAYGEQDDVPRFGDEHH